MLTEMITPGARPKDIDPMARLLLAALISMLAATAAAQSLIGQASVIDATRSKSTGGAFAYQA